MFLAVLAEKCFCCGFERKKHICGFDEKNMSKLEDNIFFTIRENSSFVQSLQTRPMK